MKEEKINKKFKFRKTNENRALAGTTQEYEVPNFDWEKFKKLPNAELFVRRAYDTQIQKLVREVMSGNINGTSEHNLQSIESVITRSFNFKKSDIEKWCKSRDWNSTTIKNPEKSIQALIEKLPEYAINDNAIINNEVRARVAEIIADVADRETDDIAEYLWVKLTQKPKVDTLLASL